MTDAAPRTAYPATAIQRAIYSILTADPYLTILFGGDEPRVWDTVPRDDNDKPEGGYPYVKIGEDQVVGSEQGGGVAESEVYSTVKIFDEPGDGSGKELSKLIVGGIADALVSEERFDAFAAAVLEHGFICTLGEMRDARHLEPADGLTEQAVLTFRFELDPRPDF
jgi:hypothetical protein